MEIARQLCIIDQNNFSSILEKDYVDYIVKKEIYSKAVNEDNWTFILVF